MGYPTGPLKLKDPGPKREQREPLSVMDTAKKLANDVRAGKISEDKATRHLIARLSYYKAGNVPMHSARMIAAASDLIYSASLRSPSYHDPAEQEALKILRDAAKEARDGTWQE